ncbi:Hsp70 family protein [Stackebrandtia nassauensis]|uniref:Chaperone protein HscA n=1 Tax=Stackebrandtia nassauensis (strain DSM 44728 / CIP 108903 / NRRL B-16338 / NBRC 102104 / LLR-40K-21) TaxID=446470 RepID=D3Q6V7_STANL|nr:Hsp70 family protein [Stackebrandtia nassauensis]ADD40356.1 chaperone protein HscA [Stackebrandtia nassauensis DSM 44728]
MSGTRLGVDYGSSHTVAVLSLPDGRTRPLLFDGSPLLPSAVHADGGERLLVGADAQRAARAEPARAEPNPKRRFTDGAVLLGEDEYPVSRLVAATLRAVAQEAERAAGRAPDAVTLTYPAAWGKVRLGVLREAAELAGLSAAEFVPEPVAAATFIAEQPDAAVAVGECVVVYDLGAGTCDVAVVRRDEAGFTVVADGGLDDAGGLDLDKVVVDVIAGVESEVRRSASEGELRHRRALWLEARHAKESLSRRSSVNVHVPIVDRTVPVTREQFDAAARPLLMRTADLTTRVIEQSGVDEQRVKGLFLVGGCQPGSVGGDRVAPGHGLGAGAAGPAGAGGGGGESAGRRAASGCRAG